MERFTIEIARMALEVQASFGSTREYFRQYLTSREPEEMICVTEEDRLREQQKLDTEADNEGLRRRKFTEPFLERAAIQRKAAAYLLRRDILLLHGSTIAVDGKAYLFTAPCGVGKSTHTRLWMQMLTGRAKIINDDRAFLQLGAEGVLAYGSPWSGKHGLDTNLCAPLAGICILERGSQNIIRRISADAALPLLLSQVYMPDDSCAQALHSLTRMLTEKVTLWQMACTKEPEAARVCFDTMSGLQK